MSLGRVPQWVGQYTEIPFKELGRDRSGIDCWGLNRLVWAEQAGLVVPSYVGDYESTTDCNGLGALIRANMGEEWLKVQQGQEQPLDGLLIRIMGQPMHVALVVADGWMLHIMDGINSVLERYRTSVWEKRIFGAGEPFGVWRHVLLS